jgi:hypothetical protein
VAAATLHNPALPSVPRAKGSVCGRGHTLQPRFHSLSEAVILKCLEKELERRYQSAKELQVDLRRLSAPTVGIPGPRWPLVQVARWTLAAAAIAVLLSALLVSLNVGRVRERLWGHAGLDLEGRVVSTINGTVNARRIVVELPD